MITNNTEKYEILQRFQVILCVQYLFLDNLWQEIVTFENRNKLNRL
jgi:hypothetical protein